MAGPTLVASSPHLYIAAAMNRLSADFLLLAAALLWGVAFYFQKDAMAHIGPLTFIAARATLATIVLAPLAWREKTRPRDFARHAIPAGAAFFLAAYLQQAGLITATVSNAGFLTALYVVVTPLMAWLLLRMRPAANIWPAIALSFAGTWALGGGTLTGLTSGDALVAVSAVFWALHVVLTSRAAELDRPFTFTCLQFATVAAFAALGAALSEPLTWPSLAAAMTPILYVGIVSSAVTFSILVIALRHTAPAEASVLLSSESLFAAAAGAILLGERLSILSWLGACLILLAIIIVHLGSRKISPDTPTPAMD